MSSTRMSLAARSRRPEQERTSDKTQREPDDAEANTAHIVAGVPLFLHDSVFGQRSTEPGLTIGAPNDRFEREAEAVAAHIARPIHTHATEPAAVGRDVSDVQRQKDAGHSLASDGSGPTADTIASVAETAGEPLDDKSRAFFEPHLGRDLGDVRIHTDGHASDSAAAINARAYTRGRHIVFRQGAFSPSTNEGRARLAHELTHVTQQDASDSSMIQRAPAQAGSAYAPPPMAPGISIGAPDDPFEREAEAVAARVVNTMPKQAPMPIARGASGVRRQPEANSSPTAGRSDTADEIAAITATAGESLDAATRSFFEPRFQRDLGDVRIHTDGRASDCAAAIGARAYTLGPHIVFGQGAFSPATNDGRALLAHELTHVAQQDAAGALVIRRAPDRAAERAALPAVDKSPTRPRAGAPRAEDLIAAKYPHLVTVLLPAHYRAVQDMIDWRLASQNLDQAIADFDRRERERAAREGMEGYSYRYLSSYNDKLERLRNKRPEAPDVSWIEIDTSKLIDPSILDPQDWNVDAERQFRESWVKALSSKPTVLKIWGDHPIEDVLSGIFWNGVSLPTEGGLITWDKLLKIPGAFADYNSRVLHSPIAVAAEEYAPKLRSVYDTVQSEYEFERSRKSSFPIVSRISEFFSSSIDWNAASKLLPEGKSFEDMGPFETMQFLGSLKEEQLDRVSRVLPTSEGVLKVHKHLVNVETAVFLRKYEAALIVMPLVADEIEELYRKTLTYRQRTLEGASTVITGLQYVRAGCNIVLTVGGGVMGKAYGLVGISAGSAAGAGFATLSQETAMQWSAGNVDPGSILYKTGKDAAMAFIGSMIGGALAGKFYGVLGTRLAPIIPNVTVRAFVIGRIADAGSGLITAPLEITVNGLLEGDWPKSVDDLVERVAKNVAVSVVVGGAIDVVTGVPNLKGKAWESLTEADVPTPVSRPRGSEEGPLAGATDADFDVALSGMKPGTWVRGPAGAQTGQSLLNVEVVSRLNDQVRALVAGRGAVEPPTGAAFERSQTEVDLAHQILANPNSPSHAVNQALEVVVQRAVADYRTLRLNRPARANTEPALTADELRGDCGPGRDVTADSIASHTIGSTSPLVVHRIQAAHLGIPGAQHAFTLIIHPDGTGFLVDPTFAQFADQVSGTTFRAEGMLSDPRAVLAARNLLRDGFVPLTPQNARDYALGLGATPAQADAVAARIIAGDASVLTEVVVNGTVSRVSARPGEAYNTMTLPIDVDTPSAGSVHSIEQILARLAPNDPARPALASLRDRLIMIAAEQQQVTPAGVGARPNEAQ